MPLAHYSICAPTESKLYIESLKVLIGFSLYKLEFVRSGHHLLILMQSYLNSILLDVAHIEMMSSKESDFGFGWGLGAGGGV